MVKNQRQIEQHPKNDRNNYYKEYHQKVRVLKTKAA